MPRFAHVVGGRFLVLWGAFCCAGVLGCGGTSVKLVPVVGKVTVDGKALTTGSVSFRPDKSKGNMSPYEPAGNIDGEGNYKLYTPVRADAPKEGAPPGWYKVAVIAAEPDVYPPRKFFIPTRYGDIQTSKLAVEVTEGAAPGTYDFRLSSK